MSTPTSPETPKMPDTKRSWSDSDYKDYFQKELDQIQAIISRMAGNSFQCKGWAIGIVTITLAINRESLLLSGWQSLILLLPILVFWYLDGFFLYTEQCYRKLFNDVVKKRSELGDWSLLFDYNYTRFEHLSVKGKSFIGAHLPVFLKNWLQRKLYALFGQPEKAPDAVPTIASVMWSKTLRPFYLLPVLFVCYAAYKSDRPVEKKPVEPVVVKVDSSSLGPVLRALEKSKVEVKKDSI